LGFGVAGPVLAMGLGFPVHAASADPIGRWRPLIEAASARCGVPVPWIEKVMRAESGGRTVLGGRPIRSAAGAMGLMQLMPATWSAMRVRLGLGTDPFDPAENILAGACYLRMMADRFGYPGAFAAYNAGPGRYADHLVTGRPLPSETRAYLVAVTAGPVPVMAARAAAPELFFVRRGDGNATASTAAPSRIFVSLSAPLSSPAGE
jgi:soluble lytic murein transglycosylase-like protein